MTLDEIRKAQRLRIGGTKWADIASALGCSIPTARKMVDKYHEHRKAGTLFHDRPGEDADWYKAPIYAPKPQTVEA